MTVRKDISSTLVHFTKGESLNDALYNLFNIITGRLILGSNKLIKGKAKCVCFSEVPLESLEVFCNENNYTKYMPFGIVVQKDWLFSQGGRPVIYQPENEFKLLPEELQWRHVTFDLTKDQEIDFTWEREWRIKINELHINPDVCKIFIKDNYFKDLLSDRLEDYHDLQKDFYPHISEFPEEEYQDLKLWKFQYL